MGLFSSKKTSVSTTNQFFTTNANVQGVSGPAVVGDGNVVTTTDHGAIDAALESQIAAIEANRFTVAEAFNFALDSQREASVFSENASREALKFAGNASRGDASVLTENIALYAAIAAVAMAVLK